MLLGLALKMCVGGERGGWMGVVGSVAVGCGGRRGGGWEWRCGVEGEDEKMRWTKRKIREEVVRELLKSESKDKSKSRKLLPHFG